MQLQCSASAPPCCQQQAPSLCHHTSLISMIRYSEAHSTANHVDAIATASYLSMKDNSSSQLLLWLLIMIAIHAGKESFLPLLVQSCMKHCLFACILVTLDTTWGVAVAGSRCSRSFVWCLQPHCRRAATYIHFVCFWPSSLLRWSMCKHCFHRLWSSRPRSIPRR
jgi:hypothetical protein